MQNQGKLDAYLESIEGIDEANEKAPTDIKFKISGITRYTKLEVNQKITFKVKVTFDSSATSLPSESKQLTLKLNFAQDSGNAPDPEPGEKTSESVTTELLSSGSTYNYMGGTYIKDGKDGKQIFYDTLIGYGIFSSTEEIDTKFFADDGKFISENFEDWALTEVGLTENDLVSEGVDTAFEYFFKTTPSELFSMVKVNNYVWFNGFMWRIMGKNADGSVRMITEENVTGIPWGAKNTAQDYDNSYINDWLNNYFYPKLKNKEMLVKQTWCSETTEDDTSVRTTCSNNLSSTSQYVGLLSLDEYNLASGSSSYLHISQYFWTLTPNSDSKAWFVIYFGLAHNDSLFNAGGVRPVINVSSEITITGGNGTLNDPYMFEDKSSSTTGTLKDNSHIGEYVTYAGRNYRVVETSESGTKLILDGYYDNNNDGTIDSSDKMTYGENCTLCTTINEDNFVNWVSNNNEGDKNKLVSTTWYRGDYWGSSSTTYNYKTNLESTSNSYTGRVGLIRVGEILSGQSETIFSKNHTVINTPKNVQIYLTATPYSDSKAWIVSNSGTSSYGPVSAMSSIRPVININSSVQITGGNGTPNSPYEI